MALYSSQNLDKDLNGVVENAGKELKQMRAGRATPDMFQGIMISAYGTMTPLEGLAAINIESATSVTIKPWDKSILDAVLAALKEAFPEFNPVIDSDKVRINIPPLTEERRAQTVKQMRAMIEEHKASIRQIRHKFMEPLNNMEGVSEDEVDRDKAALQKQVDAAVSKLDQMADAKEEELMPGSVK
jgi:ribosome recycling factor